MNLGFTDEQRALQDTVGRYCADRYPLDELAARVDRPRDHAGWRELAELGVFGLRVAQAQGGAGLAMIETALVFEELGRHLVPGPLLWSQLAAPLLPQVAAGLAVAGGIDLCARTDDPLLVEHLADLDSLLVLRPEGVFLCDGGDLPQGEELLPLDPLTPVWRVGTVSPGRALGDQRVAARLREEGTVLAAAQLVGVAAMALETARNYALHREQFGRPIGSFQAVKHMLADMYVRLSLARSALHAAAAVLDHPAAGDTVRSVATAKLLAGEAALENARTAIQVFGGLGFTWNAIPHFFLKRGWVLEHQFGTSRTHALAISSSLRRECAA